MSRRILKRITINRDDVAILRDQLLHVHTRNGDSIEIQFQRPSSARGKLCFGFDGGFERVLVTLDFVRKKIALRSTEWRRPQPMKMAPFRPGRRRTHRLRIEKSEGDGELIKMAHLRVYHDDDLLHAHLP